VLKQQEEGQLASSFKHPPLRKESCESFIAVVEVVLINFPLELNLALRVWVDELLETFEVCDVPAEHHIDIHFGCLIAHQLIVRIPDCVPYQAGHCYSFLPSTIAYFHLYPHYSVDFQSFLEVKTLL
jgi:hypothetical protein